MAAIMVWNTRARIDSWNASHLQNPIKLAPHPNPLP
jgi:hypothetical protein